MNNCKTCNCEIPLYLKKCVTCSCVELGLPQFLESEKGKEFLATVLPKTFDESKLIRQLKKIQENPDFEVRHGNEDEHLANLLEALGFKKLVAQYKKTVKHCA